MRGRKDSGERFVKNGISRNGRQLFLDKETGKTFAEGQKPLSSLETKLRACVAYFKGASYRSVGEMFDVSNTTVRNWVMDLSDKIRDNFGEIFVSNDTSIEYEDVEIDELFTYCQKKRTNFTSGFASNELLVKYLRILYLKGEMGRLTESFSK